MNRFFYFVSVTFVLVAILCSIDGWRKIRNIRSDGEQKISTLQKRMEDVRKAKEQEMNGVRRKIAERNSKKADEFRRQKERELQTFRLSLTNEQNRAASVRRTQEIIESVVRDELTLTCPHLGLQCFSPDSEMPVNLSGLKSISFNSATEKLLLKYENTSGERQKPVFKIMFYDRYLKPCFTFEKKVWIMKKFKNWRHPTQYGGLEPNEKYEETETITLLKSDPPKYFKVQIEASKADDNNVKP